MFIGTSAAGAGGQGAGGEDQLHRQQGPELGLHPLRLAADPPGHGYLPQSVSRGRAGGRGLTKGTPVSPCPSAMLV